MKKINILLLMLLMAPIFTFLLFSNNNTTSSSIIYLHQRKNQTTSSQSLLASVSNTGNVILQFYADWCGPCRRMSPVVDAFANTTPGFTIVKINRDNFLDLARSFNVTSIPTLIFLRDGKRIGHYDGGPLTQTTLTQLVTRIFHLS